MSFVDDATLEGRLVDVQIGAAIQTARLRRSIDEAPTLTLTILDPERTLLSSSLWRQASRLDYAGHRYVLVQTKKTGRSFTLTFEHWVVWTLRQYKTYRKAYRARVTRVEFAQSLCREAGVKFHAPEASSPAPLVQPGAQPKTGAQAGFAAGAAVTVKGQRASSAQLAALTDGLAAAVKACHDALITGDIDPVLRAVVMAGTQESSWNPNAVNPAPGGPPRAGRNTPPNQHVGVLQQSYLSGWRGLRDTSEAVREFLLGQPGHQPDGGFLGYWRSHRSEGLAAQIERVQRSGLDPAATYGQWADEAAATVTVFSRPGRAVTALVHDRFEFSRGTPGQPEDSWATLARIAGEIGWRRFVVDDTVWLVSDEWLYATAAKATLQEGVGAVEEINWTLDAGRKHKRGVATLDTCDVVVDDSWAQAPGVVV